MDRSGLRETGRVWPYQLAILLFPLMVLWHQDNALFQPLGEVDRWVYLGFFKNLVNFKRVLFPDTYYGTRLSWVLPGYAIHSLLSPIAAYYVLHLLVQSVATLSFFTILRDTVGVRSAFLGTMVFSVNPLLWFATGSDYVDGVGIAYCLLALALLTRAAWTPVARWKLLMAGAAGAAAICSNLVWTAIVPVLLLAYVVLAGVWRRTPPTRSILSLCVWFGVGLVTVTAAFAGINYLIDGSFWFFAPSLQAIARVGLRNNPWFASIWTSHGLQPWLWFHAVAALTAVVLTGKSLRLFLVRKEIPERDAAGLLFSIQLFLVLAFMAYMQNHGTPFLGLRLYASYLIPFSFLVIGAAYWPALEELRQRTFVLVCCGAAVLFAAVWFDPSGNLTPIWPAAVRPTAWAGGVAFALALMLRNRIAGVLLAIAACAIFASEPRFLARFRFASGAAQTPPAGPHTYRSEYERIMRLRAIIESVRNGNPIRFWYDDREPGVLDYMALNSSYLYMYSWLGKDPVKRACHDAAEQGAVFVVLSPDVSTPETARRTLSDCWAKFGIAPTVAGTEEAASGDSPYTMTILQANPIPSRRHPLEAVFDSAGKGTLQPADRLPASVSFPLDRWKDWVSKDDKSTVRPVSGGVAVRTGDGQYAWGAMYAPLMAASDGRYRFALRYKPRSGRFAFGGFAGDLSRWLANTSTGRPLPGGDFEMAIWADLKRGETILLRIENVNPAGNHPSSLLMEELAAIRLEP